MDRPGHLRASDADRDQIVDRLHRAATEGRIASDELEQRVSAALKAQTYRELEVTVDDLPRTGNARRTRTPAHRARSMAGWALATTRANPVLILFMLPVLITTLALAFAALVMWMVLMSVAMIFGHRAGVQGPWMHGHARRHVHPGAPGRGRPGRSWLA